MDTENAHSISALRSPVKLRMTTGHAKCQTQRCMNAETLSNPNVKINHR